jgi:hypothetical protein
MELGTNRLLKERGRSRINAKVTTIRKSAAIPIELA